MEYFIVPLSQSSDVVPILNLTGEKGAFVVWKKNGGLLIPHRSCTFLDNH